MEHGESHRAFHDKEICSSVSLCLCVQVIFFCKIRNYLHYIRPCVELFVYFCADNKEIGN